MYATYMGIEYCKSPLMHAWKHGHMSHGHINSILGTDT